MVVESKLINLNSNNAIKNNTTFLSNVFFPFPGLISSQNVKKASISVLNAQFPYSYYIINVYNNVLRMGVNGGAPFSLTLTRGNYNSNTLITEILAQLSLAGVTTISIALNTTTGSLSFTTTATSIEFYSSGSTILRVLGFDPSTNYVSVAKVLTAPFPLNLLNTLKIRIASYALSTNTLDSATRGSLNILTAFPVNAEGYGLNLYENTTGYRTELQVKDLNGFDIQILDDDGNLINFNNVYWTITMILEIDYEDTPMNRIFNPNIDIPKQDYWGLNPDVMDYENQNNLDYQQIELPNEQTIQDNQKLTSQDDQNNQQLTSQDNQDNQQLTSQENQDNQDNQELTSQDNYLQAEPPNYEINDENSLEQLLLQNGIYQ